MEESKEQQNLHRFMLCGIYFSVMLEVILFCYADKQLAPDHNGTFYNLIDKLRRLPFYKELIYSKLFTLLIICLVSIGTLSKKQKDLNPKNQIVYPLAAGLILFFSGVLLQGRAGPVVWEHINWYDVAYMVSAFFGTLLIHLGMDNISKVISSKLGKDKWNVEGEAFMQPTKPHISPFSVNIPTLFYYKKVRKGYLVIDNICKGTLLCGVPGSGKSWSIITPVLKQIIANSWTVALYDYKYPDLAKVAYYHHLLAKQQGKCKNYGFHVINLSDVSLSRRINPWKKEYISTLADAAETAEAMVEAMKKGDKSGGSDQFFTQSAINFLAACIYFFSSYQDGKYSSLPHVLAFLNLSYEEIFTVLFTEPELTSLLSPFKSAYFAEAFDQLEGQIGTLKIFISRLATKEAFWVFSADDFDLKISDRNNPAILVLANDPNSQNINSACYSTVLNRLTRLINSKGNLPCALVVDEVPTIFINKIENLLATARGNHVATFLGLQELPQFQQQYGKQTAAVIASVVGNVISGAVRNKETLEWLERLFGKVKQTSESLSIDRSKTSLSISERLEPLIPAGKIASLKTGEMVGILANDATAKYNGKYETSAINCRINLDVAAIKKEEQQYRDLPVYYDFGGKQDEILRTNFYRICDEIRQIVKGYMPEKPFATPEDPEEKKQNNGYKR
jgi:hypothetical protein